MDKTIQHYKTVFKYNHTIDGPNDYVYTSSGLCMFEDLYLQQLWLKMLVEYKDEFKQIIRHKNTPIYIPVYRAHKLPLNEQIELYKLVKEIEDDDIFFNFFNLDFEDFKFEEPNLNKILQNANLMLEITKEHLMQLERIALCELKDTIEKVERDTHNSQTPFEAPLKLKQKIELLRKLYDGYDKGTATRTPLTQTAYHIFSKIFFSEDFELFHELVIPNNRYYNSFSYPERPAYRELCQKYDKTEIDYLIHQYLP